MSITCDQRPGRHRLASRSDHPSSATDRTGRSGLHQSSGGRAMDHQFDVLTRVFATCTSRRRALALLAAMTVAGSRPGRAAAQGDASTCEIRSDRLRWSLRRSPVRYEQLWSVRRDLRERARSRRVPQRRLRARELPGRYRVLRRRRRLPRPHFRSGTLRGLRQSLRQRCLQRWRLRRGRRYLRGGSGRLRRYLRRYVLQ